VCVLSDTNKRVCVFWSLERIRRIISFLGNVGKTTSEAFGRKCGHECTTEEGGGKEGLLINSSVHSKRGENTRGGMRESEI